MSLFNRKKVKMALENVRFEHMATGGCYVTANHLFQEKSSNLTEKIKDLYSYNTKSVHT